MIRDAINKAWEEYQAKLAMEREVIRECVTSKTAMPADYWHARHQAYLEYRRLLSLEDLDEIMGELKHGENGI